MASSAVVKTPEERIALRGDYGFRCGELIDGRERQQQLYRLFRRAL